jgi:hypothetical protein
MRIALALIGLSVAFSGGCGALLDVDFDRVAVSSSSTDGGNGGPGSGEGGQQPPGSSPSGVCSGDSVDCGRDGSTPRECKAGQWLERSRCEGATPVCVKGTCKASCSTGDVDCAANTPRACENGKLVMKDACAGDLPVCAEGACVACAEGVTACSGTTVTRCKNGAWENDRACGANTPECSKGACVGCTGQGACVDDRSRESCTANGAYATAIACADPATFCSGAACAACPPGKYNCNDGQDGCESTLDVASGCGPCEVPNKTCYQDLDTDLYGNPAVTRQVCGACPAGWVSQPGDCKDNDGDVHPGQPYIIPSPPRDLDFNCDGSSLRRLRSGANVLAFPAKVFVGCPGVGSGCFDSYSISGGLPACGRTMVRCKSPESGANCIDDPASPIYSVECQ